MRFLFLIIFLLTLVTNAEAQIKPAQSQYLKERGFLVNPSFEQGYKGWEISGTCTKSLVSDIPFLNKTLKLTCVNQNFSIKQNDTSSADFAGQQGSIGLQLKVNFDGTRVSHLANDTRLGELYVNTSSNYQRVNSIPYVISSTSNGVEIYSDINITGELYLDEVTLGLMPDGYIQSDYDDVPVGTVLSYGSTEIPEGYLLADGTCYLKAEKVALFEVIGTSAGECTISTANDGFNVPDLDNMFLRGLTAGRSVFDFQNDDFESHNHDQRVYVYSNNIFGGVGSVTSRVDGRQSNVSVPGSTETSALDTNNRGGAETRPQNRSVVYIIKAEGRATRSILSQKSLSPHKAGFLTWSAFDAEIEGHRKADGSCILESAYPDYIANVGADTFGDCTINTAGDGSLLPDLISQNRYIRASGGSLTVGQLQNDATAVNGLQSSHYHNLISNTVGGSGTSPWNGNLYMAQAGSVGDSFYRLQGVNSPAPSVGRSQTVNGITGSTDTETRPISIALVPYIRMVDADEIIGDLKEIESDDLHIAVISGAGTQTISDNNFEKVSFNTEEFNNTGNPISANEVTISKSGLYLLSGAVGFSAGASSNRMSCQIVLNNSSNIVTGRDTTNNQGVGQCKIAQKAKFLNAGDKLRINLTNNSGVSQVVRTNTDETYLSVVEVADSETIIKNLNASQNVICETKTLSSDTSSSGTISDLTFDIEIGEKYSFNLQAEIYMPVSGDTRKLIRSFDGVKYINRLGDRREITTFPQEVILNNRVDCFKAGGTTLTTSIFGNLGSSDLRGNNTQEETYATLCKLPSNYICK